MRRVEVSSAEIFIRGNDCAEITLRKSQSGVYSRKGPLEKTVVITDPATVAAISNAVNVIGA